MVEFDSRYGLCSKTDHLLIEKKGASKFSVTTAHGTMYAKTKVVPKKYRANLRKIGDLIHDAIIFLEKETEVELQEDLVVKIARIKQKCVAGRHYGLQRVIIIDPSYNKLFELMETIVHECIHSWQTQRGDLSIQWNSSDEKWMHSWRGNFVKYPSSLNNTRAVSYTHLTLPTILRV